MRQDSKGLKRNWLKMSVWWKELSINLRSYVLKVWGALPGLGTLAANCLCQKNTTTTCHKLDFISSSRLWMHQRHIINTNQSKSVHKSVRNDS